MELRKNGLKTHTDGGINMSKQVDYRYMNGIVGVYKGNDVWVITKKDFTLELSKKNKGYI